MERLRHMHTGRCHLPRHLHTPVLPREATRHAAPPRRAHASRQDDGRNKRPGAERAVASARPPSAPRGGTQRHGDKSGWHTHTPRIIWPEAAGPRDGQGRGARGRRNRHASGHAPQRKGGSDSDGHWERRRDEREQPARGAAVAASKRLWPRMLFQLVPRRIGGMLALGTARAAGSDTACRWASGGSAAGSRRRMSRRTASARTLSGPGMIRGFMAGGGQRPASALAHRPPPPAQPPGAASGRCALAWS